MKTKAFIYIIVASILWGTSGIFVHYLAPYGFTSLQMTAARGTVSAVCMLTFALIRDRSLFKIKLRDMIYYVVIGASLFLTASLYYTSMQMTSVSTAVVLMYMMPAYVMIFSVLFLGEKFSPLKIISVVGMLVGCCLVSGVIGGIKFDVLGIIIGFISGLTYAANNISTKLAMKRGCHPVSTTMYSFSVMAIIALCAAQPRQMVMTAAKQPAATIPLLIGIGVVTFVLPYLLFTLAMRELPAGTASALSIIEPMAATIFSVVLFDERLSVATVIGIVLILGAVFLLGKAENKKSSDKR